MLHDALALRSRVFVVEQRCIYQDLDGSDLDALLVIGCVMGEVMGSGHGGPPGGDVVATARVLPPGARFPEASIGRVCTAATHRDKGLGRMLMAFSIRCARERHAGCAIRISAQAHLESFYRSLGFEASSSTYLEDGIAHLEMLLPPG